jgi:hypothetical protein
MMKSITRRMSGVMHDVSVDTNYFQFAIANHVSFASTYEQACLLMANIETGAQVTGSLKKGVSVGL